jgi:hypothetical protein
MSESLVNLIKAKISQAHHYIAERHDFFANQICGELLCSDDSMARQAGIYLYTQIPKRASLGILEGFLQEVPDSYFKPTLQGVAAELKFGRCAKVAIERKVASHDTGGWYDPGMVRGKTFVSEIPVVDSMQQLQELYAAIGNPVILRDALVNWPAFENWRMTNFLKKYGDCRLQWHSFDLQSSVADYIVEVLGNKEVDTYLPYLFCRKQWVDTDLDLTGDYTIPPEFLTTEWDHPGGDFQYLYLGRKRTVHALHTHSAAANVLVYGFKRWLVFPPSESWVVECAINADDFSKAPSRWQVPKAPRATLTPYSFVQFPGDLVFIPSGWVHAVMNITPVIGMAWQMLGMGGCMIEPER